MKAAGDDRMAGAEAVVRGFTQAISTGDFVAARDYLHDDLCFDGPLDTFDSPEPYLQAVKKLYGIVQRVDIKKMFVDGADVCLLYDLVTDTQAGTAFVCEWMQVAGDKIASIRVVFDARPFATMFGK
jgi:SnoaL-like domain